MHQRLVLCLSILLAACSSGGSSTPVPTVPALPWESFRHDAANSAVGNIVGDNAGNVTPIPFAAGTMTGSTPAVDQRGNVFVGTADGLFSFKKNGEFRWQFTECPCPVKIPCPYPTAPPNGIPRIPVGPIRSSPNVTAGSTILFGSDPTDDVPGPDGAGALFAIQDDKDAGAGFVPGCYWAFRPPNHTHEYRVRSSPISFVNALDLSLQSLFFADSEGMLRALNPDGTVRWEREAGGREITSSPAIDFSGNIYTTTPDGVLTVFQLTGNPAWSADVGVPPTDPAPELLTSPLIGTNAYVVGEGGALYSRVPNGQQRWTFTPTNPIVASPALILLSFGFQALTVTDVVVEGLDVDTNVYAVRDSTGETLQLQQCNAGTHESCRMDSCAPTGGTCVNNRCVGGSGAIGCTRDSCLPNNGSCEIIPTFGPQPLAPDQTVSTSPIMSTDAFIIFGTDQGNVCARAVNGNILAAANWNQNPDLPGCIQLKDDNGVPDNGPVLSSPAIGLNGQIYITTPSGLYIIQ